MELDLIIDILKLVVPTIIALVSLAYPIKQRNVVKKEISKKRYLENALSSLNEAIGSLRSINILNISRLNEGFETWGDLYNDAFTITSEVIRASFELRQKKIPLEISYEIRDYGRHHKLKPEKDETKTISDFGDLQPDWFIDFIRTHHVSVDSRLIIPNFEQIWVNSLGFDLLEWNLLIRGDTFQTLLAHEEVYEAISPEPVKKINDLFDEIAVMIFSTIRKSKRIEIDLDKFTEASEIMKYLMEEILNYSHIAEKFSRVPNLISELSKARKELFLKIS